MDEMEELGRVADCGEGNGRAAILCESSDHHPVDQARQVEKYLARYDRPGQSQSGR